MSTRGRKMCLYKGGGHKRERRAKEGKVTCGPTTKAEEKKRRQKRRRGDYVC